MVYWWVADSYFNNKSIQIGFIQLMTDAYGSSGSFGSIVRSKYIGHNKYIGRISNYCSKPTRIDELVHKYDWNYSYSKIHLSQLPQSVAKELINRLYHKVSYASIKIEPVINEFSLNEVKFIFTFVIPLSSFWYKMIMFRVFKYLLC